jgi:hypothetical protein
MYTRALFFVRNIYGDGTYRLNPIRHGVKKVEVSKFITTINKK